LYHQLTSYAVQHFVAAPLTGGFVLVPHLFDRFENPEQFISSVTEALQTLAKHEDIAWFQEDCRVLIAHGGVNYEAVRDGDRLKVTTSSPLGLSPS
jgi:hypothetical protein